jgi:3-oxoisoapionate kinase
MNRIDRHMPNSSILVSFYGDDFTGTTAIAETLMQTGLPTVIFTKPPTPSYLRENFPGVRAVGISGIARSLSADCAKQVLGPIFHQMKRYRSPLYVYKICSTFDSSEFTGNIGKAIELGMDVFKPEVVPVLPAAPRLKRFTVFGNHFAAMGDGTVYRLDQHPSIANHPVTPMKDADLRRHLARQTDLKSGLIDILDIEAGAEKINARMDDHMAAGESILFFDCLSEKTLNTVCHTVFQQFKGGRPMFWVGSQELGYGLGNALTREKLVANDTGSDPDATKKTDKGPILVLSGSCAIVNAGQIQWAEANGFTAIGVRVQELLDAEKKGEETAAILATAGQALSNGRSVIIHTAVGPEDRRIQQMKEMVDRMALSEAAANQNLGTELGEIARQIVSSSSAKRLVAAGGDTSGRIQEVLQIQAIQVATPIGIGAPLCYIYSDLPEINGLEVAFKGGQVGSQNYFDLIRRAKTAPFETVALGEI